VVDRLRVADVLDNVTFTGIVPQDQAPKYLMCSDIFLSPHVPNADGTPFFGSPTKLFEYMALGKGIIASDMDQLGEILTNEETALLVPPADDAALAHAIERLCTDRELSDRLGKAARELALREYTWEAHVKRIIDRLYSLK
jgi:glycosyltransferase involved in cell wall biosynthesis